MSIILRTSILQLTANISDAILPEEGLDKIKHGRKLRKNDGLFLSVRPLVDVFEQLKHLSDLRRRRLTLGLLLGQLGAIKTMSLPIAISRVV